MRQEFRLATKKAAFERAGGCCECGCGTPITLATGAEYHHRVPDALGGDNSLENCVLLTKACHRAVTSERDRPAITKAHRLDRKAKGLTAKKSTIPGSKASAWKRRLDGTVVRREP